MGCEFACIDSQSREEQGNTLVGEKREESFSTCRKARNISISKLIKAERQRKSRCSAEPEHCVQLCIRRMFRYCVIHTSLVITSELSAILVTTDAILEQTCQFIQSGMFEHSNDSIGRSNYDLYSEITKQLGHVWNFFRRGFVYYNLDARFLSKMLHQVRLVVTSLFGHFTIWTKQRANCVHCITTFYSII